MPKVAEDPVKKFLRKINIDPITSCWNWAGSLNWDGYAQDNIGSRTDNSRRTVRVSRFLFEYFKYKIPNELELDHIICNNRKCVNPDHVKPVTHLENTQRADYSNNGAHNKLKTHCPQGHEYNNKNTHYTSDGSRQCRICGRINQRKYKRKKLEDINSL